MIFLIIEMKILKNQSHTHIIKNYASGVGALCFVSQNISLYSSSCLRRKSGFVYIKFLAKLWHLLLSVNSGSVSYLTNEPLSSSPMDCTAAISWSFQSSICLSPPELSVVIRIHFLISRGNQLQMSVL